MKANTLCLFDGDGTLWDVTDAHHGAYKEMAKRVYGIDEADFRKVNGSGHTTQWVVRELMNYYGIEDGEIFRNMRKAIYSMGDYLDDYFVESSKGNILPGVRELLNGLKESPFQSVLGFYTGSTSNIGRKLLSVHGLCCSFDIKSYSVDEIDTRLDIMQRAYMKAAKKYGKPDDILVFGDTPLDIICGKKIGAATIAVATGTHYHPKDLLMANKPDFIFDDFSDAQGILRELSAYVLDKHPRQIFK
jgi:phosphoglycolate phosphatase